MQGYDGPVMVNQCVIADSIQLWVPFLKHTFITFLLCVCVSVCVHVCSSCLGEGARKQNREG